MIAHVSGCEQGRTSLRDSLLRVCTGGFQIAHQALERFLVGVVVFPVAEVGNEVLANLTAVVETRSKSLPCLCEVRRDKAGAPAIIFWLLLPAAGDGFSGFFVGGAAAFGFALVPELLAFGQG